MISDRQRQLLEQIAVQALGTVVGGLILGGFAVLAGVLPRPQSLVARYLVQPASVVTSIAALSLIIAAAFTDSAPRIRAMLIGAGICLTFSLAAAVLTWNV